MLKIKRAIYFLDSAKRLKKHYKNIANDLKKFESDLIDNKLNPQSLGSGLFKHRVLNSDKNKGKSGGYRIITFFKNQNDEVILLEIYDKSEIESISIDELKEKLYNVLSKI